MTEIHNGTIAASSTTSNEIPINSNLICGLFIPEVMTGTTITFLARQVSGGQNYRVGDGAGAAYTKTFAAGDYVPLDPSVFSGINYLLVVSGSTESAARNIAVVTRQG